MGSNVSAPCNAGARSVAMKVLFTTDMAVPYQVELFDALAALGKIDVTVLYSMRSHYSRQWDPITPSHNHEVLTELGPIEAQELVRRQDLVVFCGYHPNRIRSLISLRAKSGEPWCFWGERPGVFLPSWLGRIYRRIVLPELAASSAPIWCMGRWAVEAYRREFGPQRKLFNIPYFSKLDDFLAIDRAYLTERPCRILFSGSLIKRKGVDLLMEAFLAIAPERPDLELHFIGDGPMRDELRTMGAQFADQVHFHGFKQWSELPNIYAKADVLCAPSRYDGWGLIIPEGLASGLLVISTTCAGAALDLISRECGWVVPAGQLDPLVAALRAAVSTGRDERQKRIAVGRAIAGQQDARSGAIRVLAAIEETVMQARSLRNGYKTS
jgi:glycosyltransferase involved in cell wall biosynthesis